MATINEENNRENPNEEENEDNEQQTTQESGDTKHKKKEKQKKEKQPRPQPKKGPVLNHPDDGSYGDLQLNQSQFRTNRQWTEISDLSAKLEGKDVWIRARIHTNRGKGKTCFLLLRRSFSKVQAILQASDSIPDDMVKYASKLASETIVDVYGTVMAVKESIKTATQQDVELAVKRIYSIAKVSENRLPFEIDDASCSEQDHLEKGVARVSPDLRLDNRWIDIRTNANHAIFRISSAVCRYFREYLLSQDFVEIHSPKIIPAASEGGANVFKLDYFGKPAFLAQSPQLYKQMAICSDLRRVFEVAPVFRAENSNTHRHLTEFTGLDIEMEFYEHYHEVLNILRNMFIYIFEQLNKHNKPEIEAVRRQYPFEDLQYGKKMLILTHKEAMGMVKKYHDQLIEQDKKQEAADLLLGDMIDFSTPAEKCLGRLVRNKYGIEFYAVDKYPLAARPFYTMLDPYDKSLSNSYDLFLRGEEIVSGAQRIHDAQLLTERAQAHKIPLHTLKAYIDSFKCGANPHAGGGVGLERVVMLFLGLDNIRKASLFPRDPKRNEP